MTFFGIWRVAALGIGKIHSTSDNDSINGRKYEPRKATKLLKLFRVCFSNWDLISSFTLFNALRMDQSWINGIHLSTCIRLLIEQSNLALVTRKSKSLSSFGSIFRPFHSRPLDECPENIRNSWSIIHLKDWKSTFRCKQT